jgi:hypothetical protein
MATHHPLFIFSSKQRDLLVRLYNPQWLLSVAFYYSVTETDEMRKTVSTSIDLVFGHFKEDKVHGHNLSMKVRKGKMSGWRDG